MTNVIDQAARDPLTEARMEIVALKLTVQVLAASLAVEVGGDKKESQLKVLSDIRSVIERSIDNIDFSEPSMAAEWRHGVRKSVDSMFEKFGKD